MRKVERPAAAANEPTRALTYLPFSHAFALRVSQCLRLIRIIMSQGGEAFYDNPCFSALLAGADAQYRSVCADTANQSWWDRRYSYESQSEYSHSAWSWDPAWKHAGQFPDTGSGAAAPHTYGQGGDGRRNGSIGLGNHPAGLQR